MACVVAAVAVAKVASAASKVAAAAAAKVAVVAAKVAATVAENKNCSAVVRRIAHALVLFVAVGIYRLCFAGCDEKKFYYCWLAGVSIAVEDMVVASVAVQDSYVDIGRTVELEPLLVVAELSALPPPCACFATCCSGHLPVSAWLASMRPCCC